MRSIIKNPVVIIFILTFSLSGLIWYSRVRNTDTIYPADDESLVQVEVDGKKIKTREILPPEDKQKAAMSIQIPDRTGTTLEDFNLLLQDIKTLQTFLLTEQPSN